MKQIRKLKLLFVAAVMAALPLASLLGQGTAHAAAIAGETFTGVSTQANAWISGGGTEKACLTAASSSAANSIPSCTGGAVDTPGNGVLRLTRASNNQNGFAIYNTPVSANEGLDIEFDMYQYGGSGADGIAFFLLDGSASPTQPGQLGGSLGYSSANGGADPGIVGGYVGVGFDRWGNFSDPNFGSGGPGRVPNSITVRGNEASDYQFVSRKSASGPLAVEAVSSGTRTNSKRHVRVTVSTNNIMNVAVNYFDGNGLRTEISNINLNTINGPGSLPASFKFGFTAGTGGSNNIHEIGGMVVNTLKANVGVSAVAATGTRGEYGQYTFKAANDAGAETTTGTITVTDTLPAGIKPTAASGDGWNCSVAGQVVTCSRPGDGANALLPGVSTPNVTVKYFVAENAVLNNAYVHNLAVSTENNDNLNPIATQTVTVTGAGDIDGIVSAIETAAPNDGDANDDGIADATQASVTSFINPVTGKYVVLQGGGACGQNSGITVGSESDNAKADGSYSYPAGMMNFTLTCTNPGDSTTVSQYYYGDYDISRMSVRKYSAVTQNYETVPGASVEKVTIGGQSAIKLSYAITDGGPLDQDGVANGVIIDPAGPAIRAADVVAPNTGLAPQTPIGVFAAGLAGLSILGYGIRKAQRQA